ncbi:MAG: DCC1-like thiol-disulfide oxidoreductase family protein [Gemmatimonas sp.]
MTLTDGQHAVLLYDGLCGFCDRTIQFIFAHDTKRTLQFAALQGEFAARALHETPALRDVDSLVVVQTGANSSGQRVLVRSDAVIAIADYLGGLPRAGGWLLRLIPRALRDWGYDALAKRRFRLFGRLHACRIPSSEERVRFLD